MKTMFAGLFKKNTRNFFIWASFIWIIWMLFFDSNDLINQFQLQRTLIQLQEEKKFYENGIQEILKEKEALKQNPYLLEKLAREKYKMSDPDEDVYVTE
jgi:cell division protein FtsB